MRVPSTDVQNNFGKYLKYVEVQEEIIVTKNGRDVARLIPAESIPDHVREHATEYNTTGEWVTYEQYLELVEQSEQRYELIDGVIYNLASPSYNHQHAISELMGTFYNWFRGKSCTPLTSPFDVTITKREDNICVVQPDLLVICDKENIDEKGKYHGIPTLVVEVLSPSTQRKDLLVKMDLYTQWGVQEYWIVDPKNQQVVVYTVDGEDGMDNTTFVARADEYARSLIFEGLQVKMADMFV